MSSSSTTTTIISPHDNLARELETICCYTGYPCSRTRIDGYFYCVKHILEDKAAPYRQCSYSFPTNGKRCHHATHKKESGGMCEEHTRLAQQMRQKSARRHKPPVTPESLYVSLAHYAKIEKKPVFESATTSAPELKEETPVVVEADESNESPDVTKALDPFADIDAFRVNNSVSRIMDYASESESDQEPWTMNAWPGHSFDSSDENMEDDRHEDKLRQAGIYTEDEANLIMKDKLIRLQSLYIEQFQRLQHVLKERKRDYQHALKREKETLAKIHSQSRDTPREQRLYEKLKSLNRYHKHTGAEAVLQKKSHDRRAAHTEGMSVRPPPTVKCIFTEGGVKCGERTMPMAKHCQKHILSDTYQALFRACGYSNAGFQCNEPVLDVFEDATCVFHRTIPPLVKKPKLEDIRKETKTKEKSPEVDPRVVVRPNEEPFNVSPCTAVAGHSNFSKPADPRLVRPYEEGRGRPGFQFGSYREHGLQRKPANPMIMKITRDGAGDNIESRLSAMFGTGYGTDSTDTASEKDPNNTTLESVSDS